MRCSSMSSPQEHRSSSLPTRISWKRICAQSRDSNQELWILVLIQVKHYWYTLKHKWQRLKCCSSVDTMPITQMDLAKRMRSTAVPSRHTAWLSQLATLSKRLMAARKAANSKVAATSSWNSVSFALTKLKESTLFKSFWWSWLWFPLVLFSLAPTITKRLRKISLKRSDGHHKHRVSKHNRWLSSQEQRSGNMPRRPSSRT